MSLKAGHTHREQSRPTRKPSLSPNDTKRGSEGANLLPHAAEMGYRPQYKTEMGKCLGEIIEQCLHSLK